MHKMLFVVALAFFFFFSFVLGIWASVYVVCDSIKEKENTTVEHSAKANKMYGILK